MLPIHSLVSEYVDFMLAIKWLTSFFSRISLQNCPPPGWNWLLWSHAATDLACWHTRDIQMAPTFCRCAYLQQSLPVVVPTPLASFQYTPIYQLSTPSGCIAWRSTMGTIIAASSCIQSIQVLQWDKSFYVGTPVSCFPCTDHTIPMHFNRIQTGCTHRCIPLKGD